MNSYYNVGYMKNHKLLSDGDIIELQNKYDSIAIIDFESEPVFLKLTKGYKKHESPHHSGNFWSLTIRDDKARLLLGHKAGQLAGRGVSFTLKLIDKKHLKVVSVSDWIS